jgi:NAD(P)H-flavin reductase
MRTLAPVLSTTVDPLTPVPHRVMARVDDAPGIATLTVRPHSAALPEPRPGQFVMAWAPGVGEAPISLSGIGHGRLDLTIRVAAETTRALCQVEPGDIIGLRGPYGTAWHLHELATRPVVVVAGGIGLPPLRPAVRALVHRGHHQVHLLVGARDPSTILYPAQLAGWRAAGVQVEVTVDTPDDRWSGPVGNAVALLPRVHRDLHDAAALLCGPEVMMVAAARALVARGMDPARIQVSIERNMHCGVAHCGRCQLGPLMMCRDGPIITWERAAPLLEVAQR